MKILIISSCTSTKSVHHPDQLTLEDFRHPGNPDHLAARAARLRAIDPALEVEAKQIYTGRQHEYVLEGVDRMRHALGGSAEVDLNIVSAGYGLVAETDKLLPYEATFNAIGKREAVQYAQNVLQLPSKVKEAIEGRDLVFFLLGEAYLETLDLQALDPRPGLIFVAGTAARKWFPRQHRDSLVLFTNDDVKSIGGGQVGLKGAILKRFAALLGDVPEVERRIEMLTALAAKPAQLRSMLQIPEQVRLPLVDARPQRKVPELIIPRTNVAKNAGPRPKFFVPDWDDLVDPQYDFQGDTHPQPDGIFDPYRDGQYAHEIFNATSSYDGLLVSRTVASESKVWAKAQAVGKRTVQSILRWPSDKPSMGDCGAFSYVDEEMPPYSTQDVLQYYHDHGFDIGVSVDHLIVKHIAKDPVERERRFRLTQDNAEEFLRMYRENNRKRKADDPERYFFQPMGIAQGWDLPSYYQAVANLIEMGYKHIALGGLAFAESQFVVDLLAHVSPLFPEDFYVHAFGLARVELLPAFAQFGVSAFDSATFLRHAWMAAKDNYLSPRTGEWYTALRIPPSRFAVNGRLRFHNAVKPLVESGKYSYGEIATLEQTALQAVRSYGKDPSLLEDALTAVLAYDEVLMPGKGLDDLYRKTLEARPWEQCDCPICRDLGVEVIIFRQNDRNRRRGFHNTYAFKRLEESKWAEISSSRGATKQMTFF